MRDDGTPQAGTILGGDSLTRIVVRGKAGPAADDWQLVQLLAKLTKQRG